MKTIDVALINNMPDPALDATERQFRALLFRALQLRCRFLSSLFRFDEEIVQPRDIRTFGGH